MGICLTMLIQKILVKAKPEVDGGRSPAGIEPAPPQKGATLCCDSPVTQGGTISIIGVSDDK